MRKLKDPVSTIPPKTYTALSIEPLGNKLFALTTVALDEHDEIVAIHRSEPKPFHIALMMLKAAAASTWTGV